MLAITSMMTSCFWNGGENQGNDVDETDSLDINEPTRTCSVTEEEGSFDIFCNIDTCLTLHAGLDLSCPDELAAKKWLSNWVCDKMNLYVENFDEYLESGLDCTIKKIKIDEETSAIDMQRHYGHAFFKLFAPFFETAVCEKEFGYSGTFSFNLSSEIQYENDDWCTFMLSENWDMCGSCGCTYEYSYITIDKKTGKRLTLDDFVSADEKDAIIAKAWEKLAEEKERYGAELSEEDINTDINLSKQCGYFGNSLIFYFYPYSVGCGAEGEYEVEVEL